MFADVAKVMAVELNAVLVVCRCFSQWVALCAPILAVMVLYHQLVVFEFLNILLEFGHLGKVDTSQSVWHSILEATP